MKKKRKKIAVIIIVIAALIAIVPYRVGMMKDGGSKVFKSLTCEIVRYHKMKPVGMGDDGYFNGWRIEILGRTLCDDYEDYRRGLESVDITIDDDVIPIEDVTDDIDTAPVDDIEPILKTNPMPEGHYTSESGEYAADFTDVVPETCSGRVTLWHDGKESASGTFTTAQEWTDYYYIWMKVEGLDTEVSDIFIMSYYPENDSLVQLEYIQVTDGKLAIGCSSAGPDSESDFGAVLTKQESKD